MQPIIAELYYSIKPLWNSTLLSAHGEICHQKVVLACSEKKSFSAIRLYRSYHLIISPDDKPIQLTLYTHLWNGSKLTVSQHCTGWSQFLSIHGFNPDATILYTSTRSSPLINHPSAIEKLLPPSWTFCSLVGLVFFLATLLFFPLIGPQRRYR